MKTVRCIVADDEPIARKILEGYITEMSHLELVASCKNALEVMEVLKETAVDLLFLDINMPKISGLSMLRTLQTRPNVIITTAYAEYALEGFELSVTDYLLKPFSLERFVQAVLKVPEKNEQPTVYPDAHQANVSDSIFVKSDKKLIKLPFASINYVEAYGNYVKIYSAEKMTLTPQTLTHFLEKLPDHFLRIHKSYVINFNQLKLIDGNQVILLDESTLPIGKSYRKSVLDRI